jgi:hypothetical protein
MTITQLAALDAQYRAHLHAKAITDVRRAIWARERQHATTGALRRQLAQLESEGLGR